MATIVLRRGPCIALTDKYTDIIFDSCSAFLEGGWADPDQLLQLVFLFYIRSYILHVAELDEEAEEALEFGVSGLSSEVGDGDSVVEL